MEDHIARLAEMGGAGLAVLDIVRISIMSMASAESQSGEFVFNLKTKSSSSWLRIFMKRKIVPEHKVTIFCLTL